MRDDSPLRSPKVRNQFEHIDEKIERRFKNPGRTLYMGRNVGPYYDARARGLHEAHFGQWDPDSGVVTFWDYTISIPEIVAEVACIHPVVQAKVERPFGRELVPRGGCQSGPEEAPLAPATAQPAVAVLVAGR